jgi:hypothetical protein
MQLRLQNDCAAAKFSSRQLPLIEGLINYGARHAEDVRALRDAEGFFRGKQRRSLLLEAGPPLSFEILPFEVPQPLRFVASGSGLSPE